MRKERKVNTIANYISNCIQSDNYTEWMEVTIRIVVFMPLLWPWRWPVEKTQLKQDEMWQHLFSCLREHCMRPFPHSKRVVPSVRVRADFPVSQFTHSLKINGGGNWHRWWMDCVPPIDLSCGRARALMLTWSSFEVVYFIDWGGREREMSNTVALKQAKVPWVKSEASRVFRAVEGETGPLGLAYLVGVALGGCLATCMNDHYRCQRFIAK